MTVFWQAAAVVAGSMVAILALRLALRPLLTSTEKAHAARVLPFLLGAIGTFYGVIAGLVLSESWADLSALQQTVAAEANTVAELDWIAAHLPAPESAQFQANVHRYLDTVLDAELPRLKHGLPTPYSASVLNDLWRTLSGYQPDTEWNSHLQRVALDRVMALGNYRRLRFLAARERLPGLMWWVLIGGGVVIAVGACLGSLAHRRPASSFVAALTGMLALVLFVIYALDRPFRYGLDKAAFDYGLLREALHRPHGPAPHELPGTRPSP